MTKCLDMSSFFISLLSLLGILFWKFRLDLHRGSCSSLFRMASNMVIQIFQIRLSLEATKNIFIKSSVVHCFFEVAPICKKGDWDYNTFNYWREEEEEGKGAGGAHPWFSWTYRMDSWPELWGNLWSMCHRSGIWHTQVSQLFAN